MPNTASPKSYLIICTGLRFDIVGGSDVASTAAYTFYVTNSATGGTRTNRGRDAGTSPSRTRRMPPPPSRIIATLKYYSRGSGVGGRERGGNGGQMSVGQQVRTSRAHPFSAFRTFPRAAGPGQSDDRTPDSQSPAVSLSLAARRFPRVRFTPARRLTLSSDNINYFRDNYRVRRFFFFLCG